MFQDGAIMESHDENWNEVKSHCHALQEKKPWLTYSLVHDTKGEIARVDFSSGIFYFNGVPIYPTTKDGDILTGKKEFQHVITNGDWENLNGQMYYFPIVGKRTYVCSTASNNLVLYFCGWKVKHNGKTYQKVCYVYPDGQIAFN